MNKDKNKQLQLDDIIIDREHPLVSKNSISAVAIQGNNILLGTLVYYDDSSEMMDIHFLDKYAADNKTPGGFMKLETRRPQKGRTLISRVIDRTFRPIVKKKGFQIIVRLLNNDRKINKIRSSILLASDLLIQAGLIDSPVYPYYKVWQMNDYFLCLNFYKRKICMVEGSLDSISYDDLEKHFEEAYSLANDFYTQLNVSKDNIPDNLIDQWKKANFKGDALLQFIDICRCIWDKKNKSKDIKLKINKLLTDFEINQPNGNYDFGFRTIFELFYRSFGRYDGRHDQDIRDLNLIIDPISSPQKSILFSRGDTKVLTSLIANEEPQLIDESTTKYKEYLNVQYDMLGHAVSTPARIASHSRREIGHGNLVFNSLKSLREKSSKSLALFIQNDVIDCDGSSSMASLTGSAVALNLCKEIDTIVTGITIGAITPGRFVLDISGLEDWMGLMDFKIGGDENIVTGLQADFKYHLIDFQEVKEIIKIGRQGLAKVTTFVNDQLKDIVKQSINLDALAKKLSINEKDIKFLIGYGGYNFKWTQDQFNVKLDLDKKDNVLKISGDNDKDITDATEFLMGQINLPNNKSRYEALVMMNIRSNLFLVQPIGAKSGYLTSDQYLKDYQKINVTVKSLEKDKISYNLIKE